MAASSSSSPSPSFSSPMIQIQSLILLFLFLLPLSSSSSSSSNSTTIYEVLKSQGLPVGLLPKGITKYSMNDSSGEFEVIMEEPCNAKFENEVHYDSSIKGTLGYGQIGKLSGISAQELFLWFPVKGIRVDVPNSGVIHFDVGVADKQFAISIFEAPPECTPQPDAIAAGESDHSLWSVW